MVEYLDQCQTINALDFIHKCYAEGEFKNGFGQCIDDIENGEPPSIWHKIIDGDFPSADEMVLCIGEKGGYFIGNVHSDITDDKKAYVHVPNSRGGRYTVAWCYLPEYK